MFTIHEFKETCKVFAGYTVNAITPLQVMERLRDMNKYKEIAVLSNAFECIPGYSTYLIQEFIDIMRGKVIVQ